jgi:CRP/FNR family transcriptional regulator, cyclic AMP receptor protein
MTLAEMPDGPTHCSLVYEGPDGIGDAIAALGSYAWDTFCALGQNRRYARDAHVFVEGDPAGAVYGIAEGRVRIYSTTRGGREVTLAHRDRGQLLGELSAIDGLPRSASAVAVEESELVAVSGVAFNEWLVQHPELMQPLLRMLANRLRATTRQHVDHQSGDLVTRVASRLVALAEDDGMSFGTLVRVEVTQTELATWVGANREATSRALGRLRDRGWIDTGRNRIDLLNIPALQRLAADAVWSGPAWSST